VAVILCIVFLIGIIAFVRQRPRESSYFVMLFIFPVVIAWLARPLDLYVRFFAFLVPLYVVFLVNGFFVIWDGILENTKGIIKYLGILLSGACASAMIVMWCEKSWHVKSGWELKNAMVYAEHKLDSRTALAAIGADAELCQYYADKKVLLPHNLEEFQRLASDCMELRCLYRK